MGKLSVIASVSEAISSLSFPSAAAEESTPALFLSPMIRGKLSGGRFRLGGRSDNSFGFTLVEILIVMGLISMIAAFGLFISTDVYRGNSFRSEKNIIISILQKARSRAINNISEERHGIHFEVNKYVIFEGDDYATSPSKEEVPVSNNVSITDPPLPADVVFDQLTGERYSGIPDLTITGAGFSSTITINDEGRISW